MINKEQSEHTVNSSADEPIEVAEQDSVNAPEAEQPQQPIDIEALQAELEEARAKADDYWNRLLRAQAEMENLRKRNARELEQAHRFAVERLATELLAVKDKLG